MRTMYMYMRYRNGAVKMLGAGLQPQADDITEWEVTEEV